MQFSFLPDGGALTVDEAEVPAAVQRRATWRQWVLFYLAYRWVGQVFTYRFREAHIMAGFILHDAPGPDQVIFYRQRWTTRQVQAHAGYRIYVRWRPGAWRHVLPAGTKLKPILRMTMGVQ